MNYFLSPTKGKMSFEGVVLDILNFMKEEPKMKYKLIIGTDSGNGDYLTKKSDFVTAIVIHKIGKGGRYFWQKNKKGKISTLRNRIYQEATLSLDLAQELLKKLRNHAGNKWSSYDLEIHVDIGKGGPTREMIKEIVGMIEGNGFAAKIKPQAYGASSVAHKHA